MGGKTTLVFTLLVVGSLTRRALLCLFLGSALLNTAEVAGQCPVDAGTSTRKIQQCQ